MQISKLLDQSIELSARIVSKEQIMMKNSENTFSLKTAHAKNELVRLIERKKCRNILVVVSKVREAQIRFERSFSQNVEARGQIIF